MFFVPPRGRKSIKNRPKIVSENILNEESKRATKNGSKNAQHGSKIAPSWGHVGASKPSWTRPRSLFLPASVSGPIYRPIFGPQTPQDPHKTSPNPPKTSLGRLKDTPKTFLRPPKDPQRAPKDTPKRSKNDARSKVGRKTDFGPILDRFSIDFWSDLGRILDLLVSFTNGNIVYKPYQSVVPFKELKTDFGTILDRFSFDFCRILEGFWIDFG